MDRREGATLRVDVEWESMEGPGVCVRASGEGVAGVVGRRAAAAADEEVEVDMDMERECKVL